MRITRFEDIDAWKAAREFQKLVYNTTKADGFNRDMDLRRQMRRAAGSSMSNIAEGFDAGSDAEFRRFLRIARRSATEVQSHLYVALDQAYLTQAVSEEVYEKAVDVKRLIGGFLRYLRAGTR